VKSPKPEPKKDPFWPFDKHNEPLWQTGEFGYRPIPVGKTPAEPPAVFPDFKSAVVPPPKPRS
jgi:hypothetical protein